MKKSYHTIGKQGKVNEQELAGFLAKNGQGLLPMVDLIEQCQLACDELIDVTGRAAIQAVLQLSATQAAGRSAAAGQAARRGRGFLWPSAGPGVSQRPQAGSGAAALAQQRAHGARRSKFPPTPPCRTATHMGARMLDILLHGVSTRNYKEVIPRWPRRRGFRVRR